MLGINLKLIKTIHENKWKLVIAGWDQKKHVFRSKKNFQGNLI